MRLDKYLVIKGYFTSREKAKEAIRRGFIKVNNVIITKPAYNVGDDDVIEVLETEKPRGYWKLKWLDEKWGIFSGNEFVLDLGSSAGGFLLYASEKAKFVFGVEYSTKFKDILMRISYRKNNVKVYIEDAFKLNINKLPELDIILLDLTLNPESSFKALIRYLPKLKIKGRILFIAKIGKDNKIPDFTEVGLKILHQLSANDKKEIYYLLEKL